MVFLWVEADQLFDTLYWFAAQPGDHWGIPYWSNTEFHVIAVSMIDQNGVQLRQMIVEPQISGSALPLDTIVERIGSYHFYIDPSISQLLSQNGYIEKLKCYRDVEVDFARTAGIECGFTVGVPDIENSTVVLFPNPGNVHFTLQLPPGDHDLKIFDQLGRSVMQIDRISDQAVIGTASLPSGIYTVLITDRNGRSLHQRWIKE